MKKIVRIGKVKESGILASIFCKIEIKEGKLSISGVIGPKSDGNCYGSCGQIDIEFAHRNSSDNDDRYSKPIQPSEIQFAPGWNTEKWFDFLDIWKRWHLNDMRPGCEHQKDWGKKKLELIDFGWTAQFHKLRNSAADGTLEANQYEKFKEVSAGVMVVATEINRPKWKSPLVEKLLAEGWIEEKKRETKTSGWITETEHPEGVLSKPCPVCGYKYGTSWLREELPQEVVDFLMALPDTDVKPAWV